MKKLLITLAAIILFPLSFAAAYDANPTVRVGLYYGNSAMPSANLQNIDGMGYRFGFFDTTHTFIKQYSTNATNRISMLKDKNLYYHDGKFYESNPPSGSTLIGAYHIELSTTHNSSEELSSYVTSLNLQGIPAFAAIKNGTYYVRIGSYSSLANAQADMTKYISLGNSTVVGNSSKCVTVVNTANGKILFEYDNGTSLAVYPSLGEVDMPLTWFKGYKYHGGFQYIRDDGNISVVNFVPMQEYVKGVVPYEMSAKWPLEALKAQALCAKTYALYNYGKHGKNFDVCGITDCQVYSGAGSATENSDRAVDETYGMYLLYNGKPINAVFHSSDGGATENSENVWSATLPYLRGVYDNNEDLDSCINGRWSYEYTSDELTYILNAKGYSCSKIVNMYIKEYTEMGNVKTLTLVDSNGKEFNFSKEKARTILYSSTYKKYTHSQRYTVRKKGEPESENPADTSNQNVFEYDSVYDVEKNGKKQVLKNNIYIFTENSKNQPSSDEAKKTTESSGEISFIVSGTGWGHNVGMSQNGAKAMALAGKTAEEIIHFYYTDVQIERVS